MAEAFIGAILPFESLAFGSFIIVTAGTTLLAAVCILFTRLELKAEENDFTLVVRLFNTKIIQRDVRGSDWHAIARPGHSFDSSPNQTTFYRVEVTDLEGDRRPVMGELLGFLYGVDHL